MSQAIRESFMKISSLFEEQDAATTDIPFVKYPDYENLTEENIRMVIGFKSAKLLQRKDDITLRGIPARKVVSCLHRGTYNKLANLYNEISELINANRYKTTETSIVFYSLTNME